MHRQRILVVDDEVNARTALAELLRDEGLDVETAADAFKALGKYASFAPAVVITDLKMPGMNGLELLEKIRAQDAPASVIVMTAFGDVPSAVAAMRAGAADYLTKPLNLDELLVVLDRVLEAHATSREVGLRRQRVRDRVAPRDMVGTSAPMQRVFELVEQVAPSRATVLVTGESGTGKELIAHAIHERSTRAHGPFIKVSCAALAETLLESELFGHERGAFTDAHAQKQGRLELADGGTLFLDEVGEISPAVQVKLLRFLQEQELQRVGGTETLRVDVRIVAATNRALRDEVARGRFREDLYYRLDVVAIELPPLRDRPTDIAALAQSFLERIARANGKFITGFAPATMARLQSYDWPGNVRELENAIERAVVLASTPVLEPVHLPAEVEPRASLARAPVVPGASMRELERYAILKTLEATGGSTSRAARMLGLSTRTIQYRLHEYVRPGET